MEYEAHYTKVGIVLVTLLVLTGLAALFLSKSFNSSNGKKFIIEFRDESLSGLQVDGPVTMRGVKIGRVKELSIPVDDIEVVRVVIEVEKEAPIKTDTRALLQRNLLTGLAMIDLSGSTQQSPLLAEVQPGRDYPMLATGVDNLNQITDSIPEVMTAASGAFHTMDRVALQLEPFLSKQNAELVHETLVSLKQFSGNLNGITEQLQQSTEKVSSSLERTTAAATELFTSQSESLPRLLEQFRNTAHELQRFLEEFGSPREILTRHQEFELTPREESQ